MLSKSIFTLHLLPTNPIKIEISLISRLSFFKSFCKTKIVYLASETWLMLQDLSVKFSPCYADFLVLVWNLLELLFKWLFINWYAILNKPWIPSRSWLYSYYVPKFPTRIQLLTFYLCLFFAYNPSSKKEKTFYIPSFTLSESKFIWHYFLHPQRYLAETDPVRSI